jgi:hypothetical protein
MTNERLIELQTKRSAQGKKGEGAPKPIDFVVNECRRFIQANADYYKSKSGDEKTKAISDLIVKFIMDTRPLAEGYVDSEGKSDTSGLIQRLVQDITNYGILTLAMRSDDVYEIRCNVDRGATLRKTGVPGIDTTVFGQCLIEPEKTQEYTIIFEYNGNEKRAKFSGILQINLEE